MCVWFSLWRICLVAFFLGSSIDSTLFDVCWMNIGSVVTAMTASATILPRFGSNWKSIESDAAFGCRLQKARFNQMLFYTQFTCTTRKHWPFDLPVALCADYFYYFSLWFSVFLVRIPVFLCQLFNFQSIDLLQFQLTGIACNAAFRSFAGYGGVSGFDQYKKRRLLRLLCLADSCLRTSLTLQEGILQWCFWVFVSGFCVGQSKMIFWFLFCFVLQAAK